MRPLSARWVASDVVDAAWILTGGIEAGLEDIEGAMDAGDLETAFECIVNALARVAQAREVLASAPMPSTEWQTAAMLATSEGGHLVAYADMPLATELTAEELGPLLVELRSAIDALRSELPIEIPKMRTPEGFFPTMRAAARIEALRARTGLPPFPWGTLRV